MHVDQSDCSAAGFIIYRIRNKKPEVLGLIARHAEQVRSRGIYDIPKGQRDLGETPYECALRECYEEANLIPDKVLAGPFTKSKCWVWLAHCDDTPIIKINPSIGQKEHLGYKWLPIEVVHENALNYLKPCLSWAMEYLK